MLYAYHNKDPELGGLPQKHEHRGQRSIHLRDPAAGQPPPQPLPSDDAPQLVTWTVTQQRARLPAEDTVYWCTVVRAPTLTSKHHVIKVSRGGTVWHKNSVLVECRCVQFVFVYSMVRGINKDVRCQSEH